MPIQAELLHGKPYAPSIEQRAGRMVGRRHYFVTTSEPDVALQQGPLPQMGDSWSGVYPGLIVEARNSEYYTGPAIGSGGLDDEARCLVTVDYATPGDFGGGDPPISPGTQYTFVTDPMVVNQQIYKGFTPISAPPPFDPDELTIANGEGVSVDFGVPQFIVTSAYASPPIAQIALLSKLRTSGAVNSTGIVLPKFMRTAIPFPCEAETARVTSFSVEDNGGVFVLKVTVAYAAPAPPKLGLEDQHPGKWLVAWRQLDDKGKFVDPIFTVRPYPKADFTGWL